MNKNELAEIISTAAEISKAAATRVLDVFSETIIDTLKKGEEVAIAGLGTFLTKERAARTGRNPQTGEAIDIAAATIPKFKAAKKLKDAVKGETEAA